MTTDRQKPIGSGSPTTRHTQLMLELGWIRGYLALVKSTVTQTHTVVSAMRTDQLTTGKSQKAAPSGTTATITIPTLQQLYYLVRIGTVLAAAVMATLKYLWPTLRSWLGWA